LRGKTDLARICLRIGDQLLRGPGGKAGPDIEHVRHRAKDRDRHQVGRLEAERFRFVERVVDGQRPRRTRKQRISIRCGRCDIRRADVAAGAGLVFDHHRLIPALAEILRDDPRQHVGGSSGRERHDDPNRVIGIIRRCVAGIGTIDRILSERDAQPDNDQPAR
jgi:hypothetical protein